MFNSTDFHHITADIAGHGYERVMKTVYRGRDFGQYFTLPKIKDILISQIQPKLNSNGQFPSIYDPAAGTCGILVSVLDYLQKQGDIDWKYATTDGFGASEIVPDTHQIGYSNMFISAGHVFNNIRLQDSLRHPDNKQWDIIMTNPPFGIKGLNYDEFQDEIKDKFLPIKSTDGPTLFLQLIINKLKIGGKAAIIFPDGKQLFNKDFRVVREYLMKTCNLTDVISLPGGIFENTEIRTVVLCFEKARDSKEVLTVGGAKKRVYEFDAVWATQSVNFWELKDSEKVLLENIQMDLLIQRDLCLEYKKYDNLTHPGDNEVIDRHSMNLVRLGDFFKFKMGNFNTDDMSGTGTIPFYTCKAKNPCGFHDTASFDFPEYLLLICGGSLHPTKFV